MEMLFIFGAHPLLSLAELSAVVTPAPKMASAECAIAEVENPRAIFSRLGGAVKAAEVRGRAGSAEEAISVAVRTLEERGQEKITFGISVYGIAPHEAVVTARRMGMTIKRALQEKGVRVRLASSKDAVLSAATVAHESLIEKGIEFIFVQSGNEWIAGKTIAVQDIAAWSSRDYGKPFRDPRAGMLPPKLARIMVNLAQAPAGGVILDPFCGSGTVLMESAVLGYQAIGADASPAMVAGARENMRWLFSHVILSDSNRSVGGVEESPLGAAKGISPSLARDDNWKVLQSDARTLSRRLHAIVRKGPRAVRDCPRIDAIVTEPFLGPPLRGSESRAQIEAIKTKLENLYTAALKDWRKILTRDGTFIIALPVFRPLGDPISETAEIGSHVWHGWQIIPLSPRERVRVRGNNAQITPRGGLLYGRPGQRVWREILKLRLNIREILESKDNPPHP